MEDKDGGGGGGWMTGGGRHFHRKQQGEAFRNMFRDEATGFTGLLSKRTAPHEENEQEKRQWKTAKWKEKSEIFRCSVSADS